MILKNMQHFGQTLTQYFAQLSRLCAFAQLPRLCAFAQLPRLCAFALLFLPFGCLAQADNPSIPDDSGLFDDDMSRRFGAQIILGGNASQIDGDKMADYNHLGIAAGLRGVVHITPKISTSIGIWYSQEGSRINYQKDLGSVLEHIDLDYIRVPLLFHYRNWRLQFDAGLNYGRLLRVDILSIYGTDVTNAYEPDMPRNDIGYTLGGTFFATKHWGINTQFTRSFLNILKTGGQSNGYFFGVGAVYQL